MIPVAAILAVAKGLGQFALLLAELAPTMLKLYQAWQRRNGRLTPDERKRLTSTVKAAVASKDTTDLEHFLTGKAPAKQEDKGA